MLTTHPDSKLHESEDCVSGVACGPIPRAPPGCLGELHRALSGTKDLFRGLAMPPADSVQLSALSQGCLHRRELPRPGSPTVQDNLQPRTEPPLSPYLGQPVGVLPAAELPLGRAEACIETASLFNFPLPDSASPTHHTGVDPEDTPTKHAPLISVSGAPSSSALSDMVIAHSVQNQ